MKQVMMNEAGMSTQGLDTQAVIMMATNLSNSWGLHIYTVTTLLNGQ